MLAGFSPLQYVFCARLRIDSSRFAATPVPRFVTDNMELIFLGTSAGAPTKTRNVTGLAVRRAGSRSWCLVDCGEGTQHRLLHTGLSLRALDAI